MSSFYAERRLARELQTLIQNPIENVSAQPLEHNILEWHANVTPFDPQLNNVPFHLKIVFPSEYPDKAPKVFVLHHIEHPNVFGSYLCLDILTMSEETAGTPYRGWSKAYTVSSLLVQLQSFLFDLETGYLTKGDKDRMRKTALAYSCTCGHMGWKPVPAFCKVAISEPPVPGMYVCLRDAKVRVGADKTSAELGLIAADTSFRVLEFLGNRAKIACTNLLGETGWCSWITSKGPLLRSVPKTMRVVQKEREITWTLLDELHDVLAQELFQFLDFSTIHALKEMDPEYKRIINHTRAIQERQFRCFYSLRDIHSDRIMRLKTSGSASTDSPLVLGVGCTPFVMDRRNRKTGRKKPAFQQLHPTFDLLSYKAFTLSNIRHTVWKDAEFTSFLPLFINPTHGKYSLPLAEKMILRMNRMADPCVGFSASLVLTTLAKLMNTTVVDMMKKVEDLGVGEIQLFDSIKALEGYMSFYHLLLAFVQKYPGLIDMANKRVRDFITDEKNRDKDRCPDVGELLVYVAVSNYEWEDVCPWYVDEVMQRNARWIMAKYPNLKDNQDKNETSCIRMRQSWDATETGKRLAMFQIFFIDNIACPRHLKSNPDRLFFLYKEMNQVFGAPDPDLAGKLQAHSRKVLGCKGWQGWFKMIRFPAPSAEKLCQWLRLARRASKKRKYHDLFHNCLKYPEQWREKPDYDLHLNPLNCACADGKVFQIGVNPKSAKQILKSKDRIDIVFCVDCTGSMGSWLRQAKKSIVEIIKNTAKQTGAKRIRYGIVGYKDHGDSKTTDITGLTEDVGTIKKAVDKLHASGGADGPEAVGTALAAVHEMTWDKDAVRIAVLLCDAPPHGLGSAFYDDYPDGEPNGHDPVKIVRTMAQRGIRLYVVDCGYDKGERQCFYHGLAQLGNGTCLQLKDSKSLSKILVNAALEEDSLEKLAKVAAPIYENVIDRHPDGRFEQHVYEVHAALTAKKVKVSAYVAEMQLDYCQQYAVDCIAFCTDLQQARTMIEREHMPTISTKDTRYYFSIETKTSKESGVSRNQVRRVLKRLESDLSEIQFRKNGCCFQKDFWTEKSFEKRWAAAEKESKALKRFCPWNSEHYAQGRFSTKKNFKAQGIDKDGFATVRSGGRTAMRSTKSSFAGWGKKVKPAARPVVPKPVARRAVVPKPVARPSVAAPKPVARPSVAPRLAFRRAAVPKPVARPSVAAPKPVARPSVAPRLAFRRAVVPKPVARPSVTAPRHAVPKPVARPAVVAPRPAVRRAVVPNPVASTFVPKPVARPSAVAPRRDVVPPRPTRRAVDPKPFLRPAFVAPRPAVKRVVPKAVLRPAVDPKAAPITPFWKFNGSWKESCGGTVTCQNGQITFPDGEIKKMEIEGDYYKLSWGEPFIFHCHRNLVGGSSLTWSSVSQENVVWEKMAASAKPSRRMIPARASSTTRSPSTPLKSVKAVEKTESANPRSRSATRSSSPIITISEVEKAKVVCFDGEWINNRGQRFEVIDGVCLFPDGESMAIKSEGAYYVLDWGEPWKFACGKSCSKQKPTWKSKTKGAVEWKKMNVKISAPIKKTIKATDMKPVGKSALFVMHKAMSPPTPELPVFNEEPKPEPVNRPKPQSKSLVATYNPVVQNDYSSAYTQSSTSVQAPIRFTLPMSTAPAAAALVLPSFIPLQMPMAPIVVMPRTNQLSTLAQFVQMPVASLSLAQPRAQERVVVAPIPRRHQKLRKAAEVFVPANLITKKDPALLTKSVVKPSRIPSVIHSSSDSGSPLSLAPRRKTLKIRKGNWYSVRRDCRVRKWRSLDAYNNKVVKDLRAGTNVRILEVEDNRAKIAGTNVYGWISLETSKGPMLRSSSSPSEMKH